MSVPTALLSRLGLFIADDFLEESQCREVMREIRSATPEDAEVYTDEDREELEKSLRRAKRLKPAPPVRRLLDERLELLKPRVEETFSVSLGGFQPPQFLAYGPGNFHQSHRDTRPDATEAIAQRKVSVVVFLNDQSEAPEDGCYGGGSLVLAGLLPGPGGEERGFPVAPTSGSAVAFRSETVHEVKPVTHGERFTIVTWFF
jgi:predicted 2-oxoglutarate/Fe(II)-dependent dioxygenase YbiX